MPDAPRSTKAQRFAWCLFDFGNSAFPTVIVTSVYALYFAKVVVGADPPGRADELWGIASGLGALAVAVSAPLLGAVCDRYAVKRRLLAVHGLLCVLATALMATTGPGTVAWAMLLVIVGLYGFEGANVFYNAYLPGLARVEEMPRLSGRAWAFGYAGGLLSLLLVLGLMEGAGVTARWMPLAVAAWFLGFTLPTVILLPERLAHGERAPQHGGRILARLRGIGAHPELLGFLLALFFYMNGLNTVYVFAARFASTSLSFSDTESIVLIMVLNVVAAPGALWFGRLAERHGARTSIALSLWIWLAVVGGAVIAAWPGLFGDLAARKALFWGVAALASLCIGATQATSRTYVGQIAPAGMSGEYFGFMALAGRASAVLGPFVFGTISAASGGDQRWSVASIGAFFAVGLILLQRAPRAATV
jgi:UMF1 family MFS transporter